MLCFGGGLGESFFGWVVVGLAGAEAGLGASFLGRVVVDLAGVLAGLVVGVEDLEGAVVGFFGRVVCLFAVEGGLVFLGGSLGIFFFCSGIVQLVGDWGQKYIQHMTVAGEATYKRIESPKGDVCFQGSGSAGLH